MLAGRSFRPVFAHSPHIPATPAWTNRSTHNVREASFAVCSSRLKSLCPQVHIVVAADFLPVGHANVSLNSLLILLVLYNKGRSFHFIGAKENHTFLMTCSVPWINCKKPCLAPSISAVLSAGAKSVTPQNPCWLLEGQRQACADPQRTSKETWVAPEIVLASGKASKCLCPVLPLFSVLSSRLVLFPQTRGPCQQGTCQEGQEPGAFSLSSLHKHLTCASSGCSSRLLSLVESNQTFSPLSCPRC